MALFLFALAFAWLDSVDAIKDIAIANFPTGECAAESRVAEARRVARGVWRACVASALEKNRSAGVFVFFRAALFLLDATKSRARL